MNAVIPKDVSRLFRKIKVERFWWDGVQVNVPFHCIYAIIPNPVPDRTVVINQQNVPVMDLGDYQVPIWDPMHKNIIENPKYAIVLIHQDGDRFGLYAYPADCLDESVYISYEEWFLRQSN